MAEFTFSDGERVVRCRTEKEALWTFCERLIEDSSQSQPQYPPGTVLSVRKDGETILTYRVTYSADQPTTRPR